MPGTPNLIEADIVILGDSLVPTGGAYALSHAAPNFVRAWNVKIVGLVSSLGQDVTIIANKVEFGPAAKIDSTGIEAANSYQAGNKPLKAVGDATPGVAGLAGANGSDAGNMTIFADTLLGNVSLRAVGTKGGRGQDGGDGSDAYPRNDPPPHEPGNDCIGMKGPKGNRGGQGGQAGAPGRSGNGGNLDIWLTSPPKITDFSINVQLTGGEKPEAATPGLPGQGGKGGPGAVCPGRPHPGQPPGAAGGPGPNGDKGLAAPPQIDPKPGADGLLNGSPATTPPALLYRPANDQQFATNCSVQQLWSILQSGEQSYLNEQIDEASSRLLWVARVAGFLGGSQQ